MAPRKRKIQTPKKTGKVSRANVKAAVKKVAEKRKLKEGEIDLVAEMPDFLKRYDFPK